jgi:PAS domain S-box-containing protein
MLKWSSKGPPLCNPPLSNMSAKNNHTLVEEIVKLRSKNKILTQRLRKRNETDEAIGAQNIDALVNTAQNQLKVYTEKTSDKIYRILIEKMHEGAVTLDSKGTILYCNSYFASMVSLSLEKVIGAAFKNFINTSSKKRVDAIFKQARANAIKDEVLLNSNKGEAIPVLMSVNTLVLDKDIVLSVILTDLTIQNKYQEELKSKSRELERKNIELENANKDLTTFTYISSHDLQEPLRKIQTFVSTLVEDDESKLSPMGKEYFQRLREAAKRMQALIEDLLTYSQTKNLDLKFEKSDLNLIIAEIKKDYEEVILEKKATIDATFLDEANIIQHQFGQLMRNLISNSLKFSKTGTAPRITIKSKIEKGSKLDIKGLTSTIDYYHIIYSDNGIGFDPQYNERIFKVFQRLHSREEYKGTGMGLAICKRIVENHNGTITASGELDKGARFDIYIPAA